MEALLAGVRRSPVVRTVIPLHRGRMESGSAAGLR
jgi:hypothetical protein